MNMVARNWLSENFRINLLSEYITVSHWENASTGASAEDWPSNGPISLQRWWSNGFTHQSATNIYCMLCSSKRKMNPHRHVLPFGYFCLPCLWKQSFLNVLRLSHYQIYTMISKDTIRIWPDRLISLGNFPTPLG